MKVKFGINLHRPVDFPYFFVLLLGVSIMASIFESRGSTNSDLKVQGICSGVKLKMQSNEL